MRRTSDNSYLNMGKARRIEVKIIMSSAWGRVAGRNDGREERWPASPPGRKQFVPFAPAIVVDVLAVFQAEKEVAISLRRTYQVLKNTNIANVL